MALLVWTMVGLALWHFTVFLPDNFYGGIVGAFCGALLGSIIFGLIVNLGSIPGQNDTDLMTGVEAIPGTLLGLGPDVVARRAPAQPAGGRPHRLVPLRRCAGVNALRRPDRPEAVARAGERRPQVALGRAEGAGAARSRRGRCARGRRRRSTPSRGPPRARRSARANVHTKRPPGRSTRATSANVSRGRVSEPTPPEQMHVVERGVAVGQLDVRIAVERDQLVGRHVEVLGRAPQRSSTRPSIPRSL